MCTGSRYLGCLSATHSSPLVTGSTTLERSQLPTLTNRKYRHSANSFVDYELNFFIAEKCMCVCRGIYKIREQREGREKRKHSKLFFCTSCILLFSYFSFILAKFIGIKRYFNYSLIIICKMLKLKFSCKFIRRYSEVSIILFMNNEGNSKYFIRIIWIFQYAEIVIIFKMIYIFFYFSFFYKWNKYSFLLLLHHTDKQSLQRIFHVTRIFPGWSHRYFQFSPVWWILWQFLKRKRFLVTIRNSK